MIKIIRVAILIILAGLPLSRVSAKKITLDDITRYGSIIKKPSLRGFIWSGNGARILVGGTTVPGSAVLEVNLVTNDTLVFLDSALFDLGNGKNVFTKAIVSNARFSNDRNRLLFYTNRKAGWRRSFEAEYYVTDLTSGKTFSVSNQNSGLRNVKFSPNGKLIAYVRDDNDIYVFNTDTKKEKRITRDGTDQILNGHLGWVYEEEFAMYDGYRWSPDSKYIAYFQEDQSDVPLFHMLDATNGYPKVKSFKYPRAGEPNPTVRIGVIPARGGRTRWMKTEIPEDHYIPFVEWRSRSELIIMRMDRLQKNLVFLSANPKTGRVTEGISESDPAGWVDLKDDYHFLNNRKMLWLSERTGFCHLTISSFDGLVHKNITSGNWEVLSIEHVDEDIGKIWFMANRESVESSQLYSVNFDGTDLKLLTPDPGSHRIDFSDDGSTFIDNWSSFSNPGQIDLYDSDGNLLRTIGKTDLAEAEAYNLSIPQMISFPSSDSTVMLDGVLTYPVDFEVGEKYPLIVVGYGMPGSQIVRNSWSSTLTQYFAQEGYFVFSMDSRGMSGRGEVFKNLAYGNMARYLAPDQAAGARHLINQGIVDENRIGAWGWSGGGYFTALMLTLNSDIWKAGVAVAPVTDFRFYDTIYTERYMGLPSTNNAGYDSTSVMTWIDRMQGHLLLMHGEMDDNVHVQNSTTLFDRGVEIGKDIDMYIYPGRNHGIHGRGSTQHLYRNLVNYFMNNL